MSVSELLLKIRPAWIHRLTTTMARGADTRVDFQKQMKMFFDCLTQAIMSGDPAWVDPVLYEWAHSTTESDLQGRERNISAVLNGMLSITYELSRELLQEREALDLIGAALPVFIYALDKAARLEVEIQIGFISKELEDVRTKLEQLDDSKSNFISVAAHELKTPLTLIEGYTTMMRDMVESGNGSTEQMDTLIRGLKNGVNRLGEIIDDMIDVSLIDNNLLSLNFQPVWLSHILSLVHGELSASIQSRKQSFTLQEFTGINQMFFGDPERLYQAFRNLLTNAIKYTPDGGSIEVSGRLLPGFVEVMIKDTGIGISPEDQESIFEKFSQLGNISLHSSGKIKFKGGGPGLGLPITRGIIEAHGGTIWVESEGHDEKRCPGSLFHILLPLRAEPPDPTIARLFSSGKDK